MICLSPPTFVFDTTIMQPFEIGAWLIAILAFPGPDDHELRADAAVALCADAVRITIAGDPASGDSWRQAFPLYASIDLREQKRRLRKVKGSLARRMVAARMAFGFIEENITHKPVELPPGMMRLSLNELSKLVKDQVYIDNPENIEHRIWRSTRPVMHLAVAMQWLLRYLNPGAGKDAIPYPMENGVLHALVIALAMRFEPIVSGDRRFGIAPETMLRIRLQPALTSP